jgi:serine palmitoyltransferase
MLLLLLLLQPLSCCDCGLLPLLLCLCAAVAAAPPLRVLQSTLAWLLQSSPCLAAAAACSRSWHPHLPLTRNAHFPSLCRLAGKGTLVVSDALNHSSIVAGVRGSGAKVKVFDHNDPAHLEAVLRSAIAEGQPRTGRPWKKIVIIIEGIYSMEGEMVRLKEIVELKKRYKCYLYLDEAHSIGALGAGGRGVCEQLGVDTADVDIMMGTFTKSFGSCGGYIAGDRGLIQYLRCHCPAHLYATAMSPPAVEQVISALHVIQGLDGSDRGKRKIRQLHDNSNYFRRGLLEQGFDVLGDWDSPVMPVMLFCPAKLPAVSRYTLERGLAIVVVGFPATPLLTTRMRVCISAAHSRADLDYALEVFKALRDRHHLQYCDAETASRHIKAFQAHTNLVKI